MKLITRFRVGNWVLAYIPCGYNESKHIILFNVTGIDKEFINGDCRHAITMDHNMEVVNTFWNVGDAEEIYYRSSLLENDIEVFRITEEEALMLLVENI